jgi:hypothetical protein
LVDDNSNDFPQQIRSFSGQVSLPRRMSAAAGRRDAGSMMDQ